MNGETRTPTTLPDEVRCAECGTTIREGQDHEQTDDGRFCRHCFDHLTEQLHHVVAAQGTDVNYPMAAIGGLAGAAIGVLAWWGFTVLTNFRVGLVAVVIGIAVGKGVTILSGHKRGLNLQIMAVAISAAGFAYSSYLVNRTFYHQYLEQQGEAPLLPLLPSPVLFFQLVLANFGAMDLVFFGIVVWQAWVIPSPLRLRA